MEIFPYTLYRLIRRFTAPIDRIIELIPDKAHILDLGCGRGIIAEEVFKSGRYETYTGVDIDKKRIEGLKRRFPSFKFKVGEALGSLKEFTAQKEKFNCIIMSDLIYLVEESTIEGLIDEAYRLLEEGGVIILKDIDGKKMNPLVYLQEYISVRLLKMTCGSHILFKSIESLQGILDRLDMKYTIMDVQRLWYPHFIIVISK